MRTTRPHTELALLAAPTLLAPRATHHYSSRWRAPTPAHSKENTSVSHHLASTPFLKRPKPEQEFTAVSRAACRSACWIRRRRPSTKFSWRPVHHLLVRKGLALRKQKCTGLGLIAAAVYSRAPGRTWLEMHACDAHTPLQHQRLTDFENVLAVIRRDVCYRQGAALLSFFSTACQHFAETWCIGSGPE